MEDQIPNWFGWFVLGMQLALSGVILGGILVFVIAVISVGRKKDS